jgi:hypothetical protein
MRKNLLISALVYCILPIFVQGQYLETFSVPNKGYLTSLANDFTGVNWTLSPWTVVDINSPNLPGRDASDYFSTTSAGKLECIDLDHEVYWESPLLNISAAGAVSFSVDLTWVGFDQDIASNACISGPYGINASIDVIKVLYSVNEGPFTMIPNQVGDATCATIGYANGQTGANGSSTVTQGGLSGTNLRIRIIVNTNANLEMVTIDNVAVPQAGVIVVTPCTASSFTGAPANVSITNSTCVSGCTVSGGSITAPGGTPCPAGSVLQYQVNGGAWTTTLPVYAQTGPSQTIKTRCACESDNNITSPESAPVTTNPGTCTPVTASISGNTTGCGSVTLTAGGGVSYLWSGGNTPNQAMNTFTVSGNYSVTVTGANGCTDVKMVDVTVTPVPTWYLDADNDGWYVSTQQTCTSPGSGWTSTLPGGGMGDCNDNNPAINPGATEICGNGVDDNCNDQIDEGCNILITWYRDADNDGFGRNVGTVQALTKPNGFVAVGGDCHDGDATIYPGADELPDGKDNNCNGQVDEGLTECLKMWYQDKDGDGYGRSTNTRLSCIAPAGFVDNASDCNDGDATIFPGADELPDGKDNNCNGQVDEGLTECLVLWYQDKDGDGYGRRTNTRWSCVQPAGFVTNSDDCNDGDNTIYPGATEWCDGKDNDCNGLIDDNCTLITLSTGKGSVPEVKPLAKEASNNAELQVRLWPNPVRTELMVALDDFVPRQKVELTIMQVDGKIIQSQSIVPEVKGQQVRFDVSREPHGFYMLQIRQNSLNVAKKFIIVR